jgi:hypothetical protein
MRCRRSFRHRDHGVLAPNSPLRAAVTADGREEPPSPEAPAKSVSATDEEPTSGSPARDLWAMWLARLFASLPLVCPNCGANMRIIACITEAAPVAQILTAVAESLERTPRLLDSPEVTVGILDGPTSVQMRQFFAVQHGRARSKSGSGALSKVSQIDPIPIAIPISMSTSRRSEPTPRWQWATR